MIAVVSLQLMKIIIITSIIISKLLWITIIRTIFKQKSFESSDGCSKHMTYRAGNEGVRFIDLPRHQSRSHRMNAKLSSFNS